MAAWMSAQVRAPPATKMVKSRVCLLIGYPFGLSGWWQLIAALGTISYGYELRSWWADDRLCRWCGRRRRRCLLCGRGFFGLGEGHVEGAAGEQQQLNEDQASDDIHRPLLSH